MRKRSTWKNTVLLSCTAGLLLFGGIAQTGLVSAWAFPSKGVPTGGNVNVRDSANGNLIGALRDGQEVTIGGEEQGADGYSWYEIQFTSDGVEKTGWVRSDLIREPEGEDPDSTDTGEASEGTFELDGKGYDFASEFPDESVPKDFTVTTITYAGEEVPAAKFNHADVFLLYLQETSENGEAGVFVYDEERDSILPFVKMKNKKGYVILMNVPEKVASGVSDAYSAGKCKFDGGSVLAYQQKAADAGAASDTKLSDFYYLYGVSDEGDFGWYLYDKPAENLQRSIINLQEQADASAEKEQAVLFDSESVARMIVGALGLICLLLLALTIIFSVRYRRLRLFLEEECGEEDEIWPEIVETEGKKQEKEAAKKPVKETVGRKTEEEPEAEAENKKAEEKLETEQREAPKPAVRKGIDVQQYQKKTEKGRLAVTLPTETVDLLDLDDECEGGYDIPVSEQEDYDLTGDNTLEDEKEFERLEQLLQQNLSEELKVVQSGGQEEKEEAAPKKMQEPEFYDEETADAYEEAARTEDLKDSKKSDPEAPLSTKQEESEWDDELEFLS